MITQNEKKYQMERGFLSIIKAVHPRYVTMYSLYVYSFYCNFSPVSIS